MRYLLLLMLLLPVCSYGQVDDSTRYSTIVQDFMEWNSYTEKVGFGLYGYKDTFRNNTGGVSFYYNNNDKIKKIAGIVIMFAAFDAEWKVLGKKKITGSNPEGKGLVSVRSYNLFQLPGMVHIYPFEINIKYTDGTTRSFDVVDEILKMICIYSPQQIDEAISYMEGRQ